MISRPTLVLIGRGTAIHKVDIIAVINYSNSLPLRRYREQMAEKGLVVDISKGSAVKSMVLTNSNHLFLCSLSADTIQQRMEEMDDE